MGEVSFHAGWTFHRASGNQTDRPREVFTVIFIDKDMVMEEPANDNQRADHARCVPIAFVAALACAGASLARYPSPLQPANNVSLRVRGPLVCSICT